MANYVEQYDQSWVDKQFRRGVVGGAEIVRANREGRLSEIQGQPIPIATAEVAAAGQQLTRADIDEMTLDQIHEATMAGLFDDLIAGKSE
jgi:hypothetical protein